MKTINNQILKNRTKGDFQMHGKKLHLIVFIALIFISTSVWAKPEITLSVTSEKEVVEMKNGKKVVTRVSAKEIDPGKILIITLKYTNKGNENATNVVVDNPISKETIYEIGSAKGAGSDITFSINGGKDYKKPTLLTYELKGPSGKIVKKVASPEQYTNVRWVISKVPPGSGGELSFKARVK
jgi:uncharacterized repeat protein (TIGR01451 family)